MFAIARRIGETTDHGPRDALQASDKRCGVADGRRLCVCWCLLRLVLLLWGWEYIFVVVVVVVVGLGSCWSLVSGVRFGARSLYPCVRSSKKYVGLHLENV